MISRRIHISSSLSAGCNIKPSPEQSSYLRKVLRLAIGQEIRVFNHIDGEWLAILLSTNPLVLEVRHVLRTANSASNFGPSLYFCPIKNPGSSDIVTKATELGVMGITPFLSARTVVRSTNTPKLNIVAIEAAEQSERLRIPTVSEIMSFESFIAFIKNKHDETILFCNECEYNVNFVQACIDLRSKLAPVRQVQKVHGAQNHNVLNVYEDLSTGTTQQLSTGVEFGKRSIDMTKFHDIKAKSYGIIVGPEGGFTSDERDTIMSSPNVISASLGANILRSDTAILTSLALCNALLHG
jgi:16S rRNA (uracil1498-N3)-methyltransferase